MFAPAPPLALSLQQKATLEALLRDGSTPQKIALRDRIILLAHQGWANHSIAQQLGISRPTVIALRAAFAAQHMEAVTAFRKRQPKAKVLTAELEQKLVDTTLKSRPGDGSTHWSVRMLARQLGISRTMVHLVWQRHVSNPTAWSVSNCQTNHSSKKRCETLWGSISIPRIARWCCALTKRARFKP
jgi:putative transposase